MPTSDWVQIGPLRLSRRKFWKWIYRGIALLIAFTFVSALIYTILFGKSPS